MGGPDTDPLPQRLAESITDAGGTRVQVVIGAEAVTELAKQGIKDSDLVATPALGEQLTGQKPDLVIIRLERRNSGGDGVIESVVWSKGHVDRHVAIAGKSSDPTEGAVNGIMRMLGPVIPDETSAAAGPDDERLAQLVTQAEWAALVEASANAPAKTARHYYYHILGLSRLGKHEAAEAALAAMRAAWPGHFMIASAETLVAPKVIQQEPVSDDADGLRDSAPAPDDGSNVLK